MKQKLMTACAAVLMGATAQAQQQPRTFAITPRVGISVSNFTGTLPAAISYVVASPLPSSGQLTELSQGTSSMGTVSFDESKSQVGIAVGAEAQYQFSKCFGLSVGAMYMQQGARYESAGYQVEVGEQGKLRIGDDLKVNLHTLAVPILANVYVWRGLAVKAGLQPEFFLSKKINGDVSVQVAGQTAVMSDGDIDYLKSFALSLPIGLSYEYKNVVVDCRYHVGLTNLMKDGDGAYIGSKNSSRNSTLAVTVGYKFGL